jgi:pimeloyl-ACP methyl ester carboxylesterase
LSSSSAATLRLGLDDLGHGEPALLLLTGWCSSRQRWSRAAPLLAAHRRVVNFEWRGHGESAPAAGDFGTAAMVDDALAVIEQTGLQTLIPCSASHSGWVAIELRRRLGDRVPAIAHLDWMVTRPSSGYMELIAKLQSERDWQAARDALFEIWRGGLARPEVEQALAVMREQDADMWIRSGREIEGSYRLHGSPLEALDQLDTQPAVMHLYGQPPAAEYLDAQRQFARQHDWFVVRRLDGVRTHFSMLEAPERVAAAIEGLARVAQR